MTIKDGYFVKIEYTGTLDNGEVFDSSEAHGKPLEFQIGAKMVIPGFENTIKEMKEGEEKEIHLESKDAYGDINPKMVQKVPREHLPKEQEPKIGMMLIMGLPDGAQMPCKITEVSDKDVTLDLNHPLAGKALNFKLKLLEVKEGKLEEHAS